MKFKTWHDFILVTFGLIFHFGSVSPQEVIISPGIRLQEIPMKFYESSAQLFFKIERPRLEDFLTRTKCIHGALCEAFITVKNLANETIRELDKALAHLEDLPKEYANIRPKRGIEWFSSPFHWLLFKHNISTVVN